MPSRSRGLSPRPQTGEQDRQKIVDEVTELLRSEQVVSTGGLPLIDIQAKFSHHRKDDVREIVYDLYAKGLLIGIPDRKAGIWFRKYYARPVNEVSAAERLEEVFTELGIPPYIEVRVSRAGKTFLIGDYGNTPFAIVDYSTNPPLMFHDRRAGGAADEIVYSSRMFRYKCKKPGVVKWYDHHGNPARIIS